MILRSKGSHSKGNQHLVSMQTCLPTYIPTPEILQNLSLNQPWLFAPPLLWQPHLSGEVDPLWMPKFVAHEVEVGLASQGHSNQADELAGANGR